MPPWQPGCPPRDGASTEDVAIGQTLENVKEGGTAGPEEALVGVQQCVRQHSSSDGADIAHSRRSKGTQ